MYKLYIHLQANLLYSICFREFSKRMSTDLPFYYYTINDRFRTEEMPSFDTIPENGDGEDMHHHPPRLHRLRINHREDNSIFVPGRAMLPIRNKGSIRQRLHKPEMGMPPIPTHLALNSS